ncbi:GNAT family N-acetyltransferase [Sphingomonas sp. MMS12-HWE2-04]|uniref:GNAT family N-acetyltransferase n=1 Tax=Sphingomonas sp. MMS12-HWE2-04 TaxID=3234199 RepID=UPI00384C9167
MDLQPTLTGERVVLRPTVAGDWETLFAVARDPLIWALHPAHDRWQEPVFRRYFEDALACGGGLTILDKTNGAVIGASRYYGHVPERDEIEIGWTFLARDYWGGAYNREVKQLMLDHIHAFVETALFLVGEGNLRSQGAMRKIGGVERAQRLVRDYPTGPAAQIVYEIRRPAQ